jgi:hypothetical protein
MIRNGKIARLPRSIRDQLNRKLEDAEPGHMLVQWLNAQDAVKRVLDRDFNGRPITEQNLSDWRAGGYVEWQQHQESCEWVRVIAGNADHLAEDSGVMPVSERLSSMPALSLGKLIPTLAADALSDSGKRNDFWRLLRELARLRRDDFEALRVRSYREMNHRPRRPSRDHDSDDEDS